MSLWLAVFRCSPLVRRALLLLWVFELAAYAQTNAPSITTIAGNGDRGYSGDGGPGTSAMLTSPEGVVVDRAGNVYIVDRSNERIRKVDPSGIITTFAGNGDRGYRGDGGPATSANLSYPNGVAVDAAGNVYIADTFNGRIRKVDPSGIITTIAGGGPEKFLGEGGKATSANLNRPWGVAVDTAGNVYIAEYDGNRVRKVDPSGIITTIAGIGGLGDYYSGDGGPATRANLKYPKGVAVDAAGNVYIADSYNDRVRKVDPSGIITTFAGGRNGGRLGDGGPATSATVKSPYSVAVDAAGNVYIASGGRIRKVDPGGIITTIAGIGDSGYNGDSGPATTARLNSPTGVAVDAAGNVYIADSNNQRIRKVSVSR